VIVNYFIISFAIPYDTFYLLYKRILIKTLCVSNAKKTRGLRHTHLEGTGNIKIIILRSIAYANFKLDNGEAHKNVRKSVYKHAYSRYNMFIEREAHTDDSQLSALCLEVAPPPILLTSFWQ